MNTRRRQSGMSIFGILGILAMLGFFALCIIRMTPPYVEYLSVRDVVQNIVADPETQQRSATEIRRRMAMIFHTNQIKGLKYEDVSVYNKSGKKYIDASYEVRLPIMWRIDAVLRFDDLLYMVGDVRPLTGKDKVAARKPAP